MKKNLFFIPFVSLLLCITSCGKQNNQSATANNNIDNTTITNVATYELDSLLAIADQLIDKTVKVRGVVTHTCKHSGKRCFIVGESETSFRIEAGGEIGGFNKELVGSELDILGVVKERRLTKEYIDQYEKDVEAEKVKEDGSAETCQAELSNIESMRKWMKDNNKDYYAIYYMNGENYDVVEK